MNRIVKTKVSAWIPVAQGKEKKEQKDKCKGNEDLDKVEKVWLFLTRGDSSISMFL